LLSIFAFSISMSGCIDQYYSLRIENRRRSLVEDHGLGPIEQNAMLQMLANRARQHDLFDIGAVSQSAVPPDLPIRKEPPDGVWPFLIPELHLEHF